MVWAQSSTVGTTAATGRQEEVMCSTNMKTLRIKTRSRAGRRILAGAGFIPYGCRLVPIVRFEQVGDELVVEIPPPGRPGPAGPGALASSGDSGVVRARV